MISKNVHTSLFVAALLLFVLVAFSIFSGNVISEANQIVLGAKTQQAIVPDGHVLQASTSAVQDVIIIHGFAGFELGKQSAWDDVYGPLKAKFEADGYTVHGPFMPSDDPLTNARFVCKYMEDNNLTNVALVGHSMGGLSARYCIKELGGLARVAFYGSIDTPQYGLGLLACIVTSTGMCENSSFIKTLNEGDDTPAGPYWFDSTFDSPALEGSCHKDIPGIYSATTHRYAPHRDDVYQWLKQGIETRNVCGEVPAPTTTPTPTATPSADAIIINFSYSLPGVGTDTALGHNPNPLGPIRANVYVYDAADTIVKKAENIIVNYDSASSTMKGSAALTGVTAGQYRIKIAGTNTLQKVAPGIFNLAPSTTVNIPSIKLVSGDTNSDNTLDLIDYNRLISCYSAPSAAECDKSDLNLDSLIDEKDLNIFYDNLAMRRGD